MLPILANLPLAFADDTQRREEIEWKTGLKLEIKDFKGRPNDSEALALTVSSIEYSLDPTPDQTAGIFKVRAVFHKRQSWFSAPENDFLTLKHEQLHFDITELHARLLLKKVTESDLPYQKLFKRLDSYFNQIEAAWQRMQNLYDKEVYQDPDLHEKWFKFVEEELEKTSFLYPKQAVIRVQ